MMLKLLWLLFYLTIRGFGLPKSALGHNEGGRQEATLLDQRENNNRDRHSTSYGTLKPAGISSETGDLYPRNVDGAKQQTAGGGHSFTAPIIFPNGGASRKTLSSLEKRQPISCFREKPNLLPVNVESCQPVFRSLAAMGPERITFKNHYRIEFPATWCELRIGNRGYPPGVTLKITASEAGEAAAQILGACDHAGWGGLRSRNGYDIALGSWKKEDESLLQTNNSGSGIRSGNGSEDTSIQTPTSTLSDGIRLATEPSSTSLGRPEPSVRCYSVLTPQVVRLNIAACVRILNSLEARRRERVQVKNKDIIPLGAEGCDLIVEAEDLTPHQALYVPADDLAYALQNLLGVCASSEYGGSVQLAPNLWTLDVENTQASRSVRASTLGQNSTSMDIASRTSETLHCYKDLADHGYLDEHLCLTFFHQLRALGRAPQKLYPGRPYTLSDSLCQFSVKVNPSKPLASVEFTAEELLSAAQIILKDCEFDRRYGKALGRGGYFMFYHKNPHVFAYDLIFQWGGSSSHHGPAATSLDGIGPGGGNAQNESSAVTAVERRTTAPFSGSSSGNILTPPLSPSPPSSAPLIQNSTTNTNTTDLSLSRLPSDLHPHVKCFPSTSSAQPASLLPFLPISPSICASLFAYLKAHLPPTWTYPINLVNNVPTSFLGSRCSLRATLVNYPGMIRDAVISLTASELLAVTRAVLDVCGGSGYGYGGYVAVTSVGRVGAAITVARWR